MPEDNDANVVEMFVWICRGCWHGEIPVPPMRNGEYVDCGIDLFYENQPVKRAHVCSGDGFRRAMEATKGSPVAHPPYDDVDASTALLKATFPSGVWHKAVLRVTERVASVLWPAGSAVSGQPGIEEVGTRVIDMTKGRFVK